MELEHYSLPKHSASSMMLDFKERMKMCLDCKIAVSENENGLVYEQATKEEVLEEIDNLVDAVASQFKESLASGRALENQMNAYLKSHTSYDTITPNERLNDYMYFKEEENRRDVEIWGDYFKDYKKNQFSVVR